MKTISVADQTSYEILIGEHLICNLGAYVSKVTSPGKAIVVSDSTVWSLYGATATGSLAQAGFNVIDYILPSGEQGKSADTYLKLLGYIADNHVQKHDLIIALGGNVVCDICGFVAATYLLGISYIQVPTTPFAMINAPLAKECTIHLTAGRNRAGVIYCPKLVLCDIQALTTITDRNYLDSCAEIIKLAVLFDFELFNHLKEYREKFDRFYVISRCIELGNELNNKEIANKKIKQLLRFGEVVGNAIELTENYTISHGRALALGIAAASRASQNLGFCTTDTLNSILELLGEFTLPIGSAYVAEDIHDAALSVTTDKNAIDLILPQEIGNCIIYTTDDSGLKQFIEKGL